MIDHRGREEKDLGITIERLASSTRRPGGVKG